MSRRRDPGKGGNRTPQRRGSEQARQAGDRAFGRPPAGPQWPGREPSEAERTGVPATDTQAHTPLGVGTSTTRRAERIARTEPEAGRRREEGVRGRSRRPHGRSEPEDDTGVAPRRPSKGGTYLPTGDQSS